MTSATHARPEPHNAVIKVGYVKYDGATDPDRVVEVTCFPAPTSRKVLESSVFRNPTEPPGLLFSLPVLNRHFLKVGPFLFFRGGGVGLSLTVLDEEASCVGAGDLQVQSWSMRPWKHHLNLRWLRRKSAKGPL